VRAVVEVLEAGAVVEAGFVSDPVVVSTPVVDEPSAPVDESAPVVLGDVVVPEVCWTPPEPCAVLAFDDD